MAGLFRFYIVNYAAIAKKAERVMNENTINFPRFCGNPVTEKERTLIFELVDRYKGLTRTELASTVCELLEWVRPNGKIKTLECRQFLEILHHNGILKLPAKQARAKRCKTVITLSQTTQKNLTKPLQGTLSDYRPIILNLVKTDEDRTLWKGLIERYHYLGCRLPFGAHLRYFIRSTQKQTALLGCLQFSSPAWRMASRDQWIGWSDAIRAKHLQRLINNSRFLLLPNVSIKNLASHVLAQAAHQVIGDWQASFNIKPLLIETLVDVKRFNGGCYRAANWLEVGMTTGRGRQDRQHKLHNVSPKRVFLYPLQKNARQQLRAAA